MRKVFASIGNSHHYAYVYDSSPGYKSERVDINRSMRMYETYGHGMIAHSPDWPVSRDYMADYLASLAAVMVTDDELAKEVSFEFGRGPAVEELEFAATVAYKEPKDGEWAKPRYYSMEEKKITASESKRHDKRYAEIQSWHDGSAKMIFRLVTPDYADGLYKFAIAHKMAEWCNGRRDVKAWVGRPAEFLEWTDNSTKGLRDSELINDAFELCKWICQSRQIRINIGNRADRLKRNLTPAQCPVCGLATYQNDLIEFEDAVRCRKCHNSMQDARRAAKEQEVSQAA